MEQLEDQLGDLVMMTNCAVCNLQVTNQVYCWDIAWSEHLINKLLIQVMVLEGWEGNLIEIPNSLALIPVPPPGGNLLVEIMDRTDDDTAQAAAEDQVEVGVLQVLREEGGVFGIEGETFKEGKDVIDVLRWMAVRDMEIPRYPQPLDYDNCNYIPDVQQ